MTEPPLPQEHELDAAQYRTESITRYELVYGRDFVSPGGADMATELVVRLGLEPGDRVLDAGCGIGGAAFLMARDFGLRVRGIDLSQNMLEIARRKLAAYELAGRVELVLADCLELDADAEFDAVYSRDVFLHVADKRRLFARLWRALRPGGVLLFTDYCCGPAPWSPDFAAYVEERGYHLLQVGEYAELLRQCGFVHIEAEDLSTRFAAILRHEIDRIRRLDLPHGERAGLESSWRTKLARCEAGDHRWGLFVARRPVGAEPIEEET